MLGWHRRQRWAVGRPIAGRRWSGGVCGPRIVVSDQGFARVTEIDLTSGDALARAALACHDEAELTARLRRRR